MSERNDDNIEKFFRKAAGQYDTEYNESDWLKLEQRLDEEIVRQAVANAKRSHHLGKVITITGVVMLLVGITSYFIFESSRSQPNQEQSYDLRPTDKKVNTDDSALSGTEVLQQVEVQDERSGGEKDGTLTDDEDADAFSAGSVRGSTAGKISPSSGGDGEKDPSRRITSNTLQPTGRTIKDQAGKESKGEGNAAPAIAPALNNQNPVGLIRENSQDESSLQIAREPNPSAEKELPAGHIGEGKVDGLVESASVAVDASDALTPEPGERETGSAHRKASPWSIRLALAPDFSSTPARNYTSPGEAYGLMIHYHLKRWNISSGLLRSTKKYWGYGDEYKPPKGYWRYATNGVVPEKVDGNCTVLEIPLLLAFNVVEARRSRLFASVGVSSYLMRSEAYKYTFEDINPGAQGWSTDESSSYLFSIGSLSFGYEYNISPALSIGIEPYFRIPFSGVGWASVDLYSTGAFFSARYRFLKRERPPPLPPD